MINQFGQGARSVDDLLDQFSQPDKEQQRKQLVSLYYKVAGLALTDSDIEQALAECSLTATDPIYDFLHLSRFTSIVKGTVWLPHTAEPPEGKLEPSYTVLLHLFKLAYQRQFEVEKANPTKWWYWDLSNPEIVQGILTRHQELIEEVYADPGFRSEFVTIAKLWSNHKISAQTRKEEPALERQTKFKFLSYDEMVTKYVEFYADRDIHAAWLLGTSVEKALAVRYRLDDDQARRLTLAVIEKHLRETYNMGLC